MRIMICLAALVGCVVAAFAWAGVTNGGFESGGFDGWEADANWVVVDNSCGYYSGWAGKYWAWSGGKGEGATGVLRSKPFVLDKDAVRMLISGWASVGGTGKPRTWNYVSLNLADGTEIDRVYAPNTTAFVPALLDGSEHRGKLVYIEAMDDADQATFSMLCIDDVITVNLPASYTEPAPPQPVFDPKKSIKIEDDGYLVVVSRSNGSVTRILDKKCGLDLISEPRLAGSFRFALPIPGKEPWQTIEANWIFGRDQKLSLAKVEPRKVTLRWNAPLTNYLGEEFGVSATETIELTPEGVLLSLRIENPTKLAVGETYFPVIGGIRGLGRMIGQLKTTELVRPAAGGGRTTTAIFQTFVNVSPFGDQGPEQFYAYPESQPEPWVELRSPKAGRSVIIGARDPADRKKVVRLELVPASSGAPREDGNWPRPEETKGLPVGVELSFVDTAGGPAGKAYEASPVLVRFDDAR